MRDPKVRNQMNAFVIKYGHSQTRNWKKSLRFNPPTFHLDLAVSAGSKTSSFVITTSQVERVSIRSRLSLHMSANDKTSDATIQDA